MKFINLVKKYLPSILSVLGTVAVALAPQIQGLLAKHPEAATTVAALWAILNHWLPSPSTKS